MMNNYIYNIKKFIYNKTNFNNQLSKLHRPKRKMRQNASKKKQNISIKKQSPHTYQEIHKIISNIIDSNIQQTHLEFITNNMFLSHFSFWSVNRQIFNTTRIREESKCGS